MKAIALLAWRNLWRNRRRTALTVGGVSFAAAILIFFQSIQFSAFDASIASTSNVLTGHLQVQRSDYLDHPELKRSYRPPAGLIEQIRALPNVAGAAAGSETAVIVSTGERSFVAQLSAVDPEAERGVSNISARIVAGRYLEPSVYGQVVVGEKLAHNLGIKPGADLSLISQDRRGSLVSEVLIVAGIVRSGMGELDRILVQTSRSTFDQLFSMEGEVNRIKILVTAVDRLPEVRAAIDGLLNNSIPPPAHTTGQNRRQIVTRSWDELAPGLRQAIDLDMSAAWMFYGALLLICTLSVLNTFLMAVLEREGEFSLLLALGLRPVQIGISISLESLLLIAVGLLGGAAAAAGLLWYFSSYGFVIPGSEEMLKVWGLPSRLYPRFMPIPWLRGLLAVLIAGLASMALPLFRLRLIRPVESRR